MRIGFIDYLGSFPLNAAFRLGIQQTDWQFVYDTPSRLNALFKEGKLDISQVSSTTCLEGSYPYFQDFGIAARKKILSVNLYLKNGLQSLQGKVGLTSQSSTSHALLKVLCAYHWKVAPQFSPLTTPYSQYDAVLLIGDEALNNQHLDGFEQTLDLADIWTQFTSLPFVFSLFAIGNHVSFDNNALFHKRLEASLNWGENNPEEILALAQKRSNLPLSFLRSYYDLHTYRLTQKEREGFTAFTKLITITNLDKNFAFGQRESPTIDRS